MKTAPLSFLKLMKAEKYLLQILRLLLLLVATLCSSHFVPLPPPLPPLVLLRCRLKARDKINTFNLSQCLVKRNVNVPETQTSRSGFPLSTHLSLVSRSAGGSLVGPVRAGAGPVGAHVDAEPAGQPLGLDGEPQLLLHDGREVGEVVQGERARRGQAGHQGGAADVGQRGTRVLQHHSGNTQGWMRSARLTGIILGGRAVIEFYYRNYLLFSF